ncbi:hypothetical protein BDZ89DRAFT_1145932 [Hymenopellis radicata]|nr:hypothetical protein BDZ89DRAFT_1145932 [Hymenopellis radicata]
MPMTKNTEDAHYPNVFAVQASYNYCHHDVGASAKHGGALVGGPDDATFDQVGCQFTKCRNSTCGDFKGIDPSGFTAAQLERMPSAFVIDNVLLPFREKFKPDFTISELQEKLVSFFKNSKKDWALRVPAPLGLRRLTFAVFLNDNAPPQVFELEVAATGPIKPTNYLKKFGRNGVHAGLHLEQYIPELMEFRPFLWQSALTIPKRNFGSL